MPSKTEEYLALAQRTANGLTRYWESWIDYLTTASRLYKYPFADQLMIYAQRPDATACADYDIWNNRMNRYVRRGSKGIALLDESSGYPRLHYVFDVSDTGVRRNSRDPERWEMNDDLFKPVSEMLTAEYGISHERLSQQLVNIAEKLVNDYWDNNSGDILNIVDGSFFDDYDSSGKELQFKAAATMSVTYTLLERCGFEPEGYFDKDDFQAIHTFSTPDAVYALGAATSDISREVLRKIERTLLKRQIVTGQVQQAVEQHRGVTVGENKAVTIVPGGIVRVVLQEVVPQDFGNIGHAHRCAGMARIGFLHGIHAEGADGIGELFTGHSSLRGKVKVWQREDLQVCAGRQRTGGYLPPVFPRPWRPDCAPSGIRLRSWLSVLAER